MPEPPQQEQTEQKDAPQPPPQAAPPAVPATGRRAAFQDLKIQLTEAELANPGTQKCILDMLIRAEEESNDLKEYRAKYYEADKRAGILEEKLKSNKINEVMFGVGVGVGCATIGLAPYFWDNTGKGPIVLTVGLALVLGATYGRISFK
ncbi:MAG: hypothetical protein KGJ88_05770 [Verrucomicrobiota bacterium]|nr:hypothetical protein [Verrucomicrobiota bacterium]